MKNKEKVESQLKAFLAAAIFTSFDKKTSQSVPFFLHETFLLTLDTPVDCIFIGWTKPLSWLNAKSLNLWPKIIASPYPSFLPYVNAVKYWTTSTRWIISNAEFLNQRRWGWVAINYVSYCKFIVMHEISFTTQLDLCTKDVREWMSFFVKFILRWVWKGVNFVCLKKLALF